MIERNRERFREHVYPVMQMRPEQLVNLDQFSHDKIVVMVDCCADVYKKQFPAHSIVRVEGVFACKNYAYQPREIDHIFDDKDFELTRFPDMNYPGSVLLMDHSLFIKYRNGKDLQHLLTQMTHNIDPDLVIVRHHSFAFDEYRFGNRVAELMQMIPDNYTVSKLHFDEKDLDIRFRKKKTYSHDSY